jgi:hypothetical protein
MPNERHCCLAGCGRAITWAFAICSDCEKLYGRSPKVWPEWLAFLWRDEQRLRRQHKRVTDYETSFCDLPESVVRDERTDPGEDCSAGDGGNDS